MRFEQGNGGHRGRGWRGLAMMARRGGGPFGGFGGPFGEDFGDRGGPGGRGRRGRMFGTGELRLVILHLLGTGERHGYELIKAVEQASGGAYSPSPGVIYPTLTLLEELGYVTAADENGGKKLYTLAPEGEAFLEANRVHVDGLSARMAEAAARSTASAPQILRATENLKTALRMKLTGAQLTPEQVTGLAQVLDDAVRAIDQV